jgi:hypothetical protein
MNIKKFHLLNWAMVHAPLERVCLAIKDRTLMNLALGAKILWRFIIGNLDWWKKLLYKKYLEGGRLICLDNLLPTLSESPIW